MGPGEGDLEDDEDWVPGGKRTGLSNYTYRAWTLGAGPMRVPRFCLVLGGTLSTLGLLRH